MLTSKSFAVEWKSGDGATWKVDRAVASDGVEVFSLYRNGELLFGIKSEREGGKSFGARRLADALIRVADAEL